MSTAEDPLSLRGDARRELGGSVGGRAGDSAAAVEPDADAPSGSAARTRSEPGVKLAFDLPYLNLFAV